MTLDIKGNINPRAATRRRCYDANGRASYRQSRLKFANVDYH